ncbi:MAG TPA: HNH endonuclease, partial [Candidatus Binatia bacterium]|nr:HNH endonuclease [Candidatus Binatia bacterium]
QVPGCSRRGMLHAHHVWYRSHGGPDFTWNLATVCNDHHREYIHRGYIRVEGCAPDGLVWELGCRPGHEPVMRLRGDVYLRK